MVKSLPTSEDRIVFNLFRRWPYYSHEMSVFSLGRNRPSTSECSALWKGCSVMQILLPALHRLWSIQMLGKRHLSATYFLLVLGRASHSVKWCDSFGAGVVSSAGLCSGGTCCGEPLLQRGLGEPRLSLDRDKRPCCSASEMGWSWHTACLAAGPGILTRIS